MSLRLSPAREAEIIEELSAHLDQRYDAVHQRVREFGVRRALGATTSVVLRPVVLNAVRVMTVGVLVGLALTAAVSRVLVSMLFGVQPLDPVTLALVPVLLSAAAILAAAGPAWRATRVDPASALRSN